MQENELPKNMGKKIVDALKQQDFENATELDNDNLINSFDDSDEISFDSLEETKEEATAFSFNTNSKEYQPVFSVSEEDVAQDSDLKLSIENEEDVEEFEMPNNINVLKRLISQLPTGVPRQTGAQIIRQTIEALGIPMKTVLQDAQRVRDCLNSSIKDCNYTIQEYKSNIRTLEKQATSYQKQLNKLNDIIGLFVYGEKK
ncbi:MAG: hypothetical protein IJD57_01720 [Candidatus Gastranaerophilales bacterium]|nr:hypothetical protein [Candidatus Gastranaerophilales bacterium]